MFFPHTSVVLVAVLATAASGIAVAQTTPDDHQMRPAHQQMMQSGKQPMEPGEMQEMMRQRNGRMPMGGHGGMHAASTTPTLPSQDAFGAIQEIVRTLDADPNTDWSKVDLEALRQHLIDMNEVTLRADAAPKQIDGVWRSPSPAPGVRSSRFSGWSPPGRRPCMVIRVGVLKLPHCRMANFLPSRRLTRRRSSTFAAWGLSAS